MLVPDSFQERAQWIQKDFLNFRRVNTSTFWLVDCVYSINTTLTFLNLSSTYVLQTSQDVMNLSLSKDRFITT